MKIEKNCNFSCCNLPDKEKKNLLILELIAKKGLISRTEISKETGINIVSVSNYVTEYLEKNIVSEKGLDVSSGGRKPELIELNKDANHVIGVEAGAFSVRAVLTDFGIKIKAEASRPASSDRGLMEAAIGSIKDMMAGSGIAASSVRAVGIAVSDGGDRLGAAVEKEFGMKALTASGALCAAFGERRLNPAADVGTMLYMHSDLGRGVVIKDGCCIGADRDDGIRGAAGYLEPWGASMGLVAMARREVARGVGTSIVEFSGGKLDGITEETVIEAASRGDKLASDIVVSNALGIGLRMAYLVNLFDPQAVVSGGGVERSGNLFFDAAGKMVRKMSLRPRGGEVKIIPSSLGKNAPILGACHLAIREVFLKA